VRAAGRVRRAPSATCSRSIGKVCGVALTAVGAGEETVLDNLVDALRAFGAHPQQLGRRAAGSQSLLAQLTDLGGAAAQRRIS
jgi:hypothetical protein